MARFTLRLPETLHQELESRAEREQVSLNQYIVYTLARHVAATYTVQVLPEEHLREQRQRYDALLENLGRPALEATRAFLADREAGEPEEGLTPEIVERLRRRIDAQKDT